MEIITPKLECFDKIPQAKSNTGSTLKGMNARWQCEMKVVCNSPDSRLPK